MREIPLYTIEQIYVKHMYMYTYIIHLHSIYHKVNTFNADDAFTY